MNVPHTDYLFTSNFTLPAVYIARILFYCDAFSDDAILLYFLYCSFSRITGSLTNLSSLRPSFFSDSVLLTEMKMISFHYLKQDESKGSNKSVLTLEMMMNRWPKSICLNLLI